MLSIEPIDWQPFRTAFPILFRGDSHQTFSVGVGWREVIWNLCSTLETIAQAQVAEGKEPIRVYRIREKCSVLFFRVEPTTEEAARLIQEAQILTDEMCEVCSAWGDLVDRDGWLKTLCPRHALMALGPGSSTGCDLHESNSRLPRDEEDET